MNTYLEKYVSLVNFLGETLGSNTEIILHDVTDCANSVVAIKNGHISGRKVGSPITDLGLKILKEANQSNIDYMAGYVGYSKDGNMTKSSTWIIRNDENEIVGMLCMNVDYSELRKTQESLKRFAEQMELPILPTNNEGAEYFNMNVNELVESNLKKAWPGYSVDHPKLSQKEKVEIVSRLNEMGTFYMKGAVASVAEQIGSSIPTIYRYLNVLKKQ